MESPQRDRRGSHQVCQGLGPGQGRTAEQSPLEATVRDPFSVEDIGAGPPVVLMPLQGPGGMVGAVLGKLRVTIYDDAEAYDWMTVEERQQLWNETGGAQCICGTWSMFDTHDGGWAPAAAVDGMLGCHNTSVRGSDFCLYTAQESQSSPVISGGEF